MFGGVDPGKRGGIALIDERGRVLELMTTPMILVPRPGKSDREDYNIPEIAAFFRERAQPDRPDRGLFVVVERLHPLPGKFRRKGGAEVAGGGTIANFNRGLAQGWTWMLAAYRIPHVLVLPQVWQRALMAAWDEKADPKTRSTGMAKRLWPGVSLKRTPRSRTDDDGLAEALLLAEYARRTYQGGAVFAAAARA